MVDHHGLNRQLQQIIILQQLHMSFTIPLVDIFIGANAKGVLYADSGTGARTQTVISGLQALYKL